MSAKQQYEDAYERLIHGKGKVVKRGEPINIANVAKEAGRERSALRTGRGFDELIDKIKAHTEGADVKRISSRNNRIKKRIENDKDRIFELETENSKLKSQNLSLLLRVYNLEVLLKENNIKQRSMSEVIDILERVEGLEDGVDW